MSAREALHAELTRLLREAQARDRMVSAAAAVFRGGELLWQDALGLADVEAGAVTSPETQYRIGSITKTFTAVCVLQLRDAGKLDLADPLDRHLPETGRPLELRRMLAHLSGIQREPPGEIWETLAPPDSEELIARLGEAEQVLAPGERWHYSNLAFSLLGEVVARVSGLPYPDYLRTRVLEPLGLERTTLDRAEPAAHGYYVEPFSDAVRREPELRWVGSGAAGWLWSTVGDLARFGAFLAAGDERVLARRTLDEMALPQTIVDPDRWTEAWGLGLQLARVGERIYAGHGGAMPGYLAGLVVDRVTGTGAALLTNVSGGPKPVELAVRLAERAAELQPPEPEEWRPDAGPPADVAALLGLWWLEGDELVLSWRRGRLEARLVHGTPGRDAAVLQPEGGDRWRIVSGFEHGELLRVVRDERGGPVKLYLATYPATREPRAFGQ